MKQVVVLQVRGFVLKVLGVGQRMWLEGFLSSWGNMGIIPEEGKVGDRSEGISH